MRQAIGMDIGGTGVKAARVDADGRILAHTSEPTGKSASAVIAQVDAMIAALDHTSVCAIGIGVPSRVNTKTGTVFPGGYVDLSGPPLKQRLANVRGRPVFTGNDGAMALLAEARLGAARGRADAIMLTIGTGIGGAVMLQGKIWHGRATAGQLGHITVVHDGVVCACGRRGCLETVSSGTALGRHIAEAGLPATTRAEDLVARPDPASRDVIERWIAPLRSGIDSLVATVDPDIIVLGGGLGQVAAGALERFPATSSWFQCKVVPAALGGEAGVVGAALAALEAMP